MTDLSTFESYLRLVIDRISKDASTIRSSTAFLQSCEVKGISSVKHYVIDICRWYLDTATPFLFGESFDSLCGSTSTEAQQSFEAFDYAMFGSGRRIALGPPTSLFRNSKWHRACKKTHRFADSYVDKALQWH